jgi:hypothetical protein
MRDVRSHAVLGDEEGDRLKAAVISRVRAERTASFFVRVRAMFDDMHFVYAGAGAAVAALFCVISATALLRVVALASPGSYANPVPLSGRVLAPVALNGSFATLVDPAGGSASDDGGDSVFMIRAVITREGTVLDPEVFHAISGEEPVAAGTREDQAAQSLIGAFARARFEPGRVDGVPVAVNMVWMVANTTVRAETPTARPARQAPPSGSRKPVAWWIPARTRAAAA